MIKLDYDSQIVSTDELQKWSRHFVDEYLNKLQIYPPIAVDLSFCSTRAACEAKHENTSTGPIHSVRRENQFSIHICEESLKGIPHLVLQGWLDQELTSCLLKLQPESFMFSFSKQFLPRLPVSGSAVNLLRHLVEHLKSGLKRHFMTKMIVDLGHGLPQVYLYFFKIMPCPEERDDYLRIIPHNWIRAAFLCRKLEQFIPISLLANRSVGFSGDLKSHWWNYHEYLLAEDRSLLEELAAIPDRHLKEPFSSKLVEMFRRIQSHLFDRQDQLLLSDTVH